MMRDPLPKEFEPTDNEQNQVQEPADSRIAASNAIKYTAYIMLFFGFLYFVAVYLAPMMP